MSPVATPTATHPSGGVIGPAPAAPPTRTRRHRQRGRAGGLAARVWALLFALPYLAHLALLVAFPVGFSLYISFTDWDMIGAPRWAGLDNFTRLVADERFWASLGHTVYFAVLFVPAQTGLALLLALALNRRLRGMQWIRAAYFIPVVSSWAVIAYVADAVFNGRYGIANAALRAVGLPEADWLASPTLVIPTLAAVAVWKGVGYIMVLFLAGLQAVPAGLYEAAIVDGAGAWARFRHVTLPMISGTTFLVVVLSLITTFQAFEQVYAMTGGGPQGASEVTVLYLYEQGFRFYHMGYASAIAWVLFAVVFALTLAQIRLQRRWVHYA